MRVELSRGTVDTDHLTSEQVKDLLVVACIVANALVDGCPDGLDDELETLLADLFEKVGLEV